MLQNEDSNLDYLVIYIPNQSSVKYRTIDLSQLVEYCLHNSKLSVSYLSCNS